MSERSPETKIEDAAAEQDAPGARCRSCGTPLVDGQEWCLECGSARTANRWRSGRRPLLLTAGLTVSLLGVAVAASYAAIVDQPSVAPTATVPAPPVVASLPPATTTADVVPTGTPPVATTPKVDPAVPTFPDPSTGAGTSTPGAGGGTGTGGSTTTPTTTTPTTTTTKTTPKPTTPTLTQIKLAEDAAALYDPQKRQLAPDGGDPGAALGDDSTAWIVQTDPTLPEMNVGLLLTLPKASTVSQLTFQTSTPGFTVKVYGSFEADLPTDVNDSRWAFLRTRKDVDGDATKDDNTPGDGKERITLPDDGSTYKLILLWLTTSPDSGPPAKVSAVKLYK